MCHIHAQKRPTCLNATLPQQHVLFHGTLRVHNPQSDRHTDARTDNNDNIVSINTSAHVHASFWHYIRISSFRFLNNAKQTVRQKKTLEI